MLAVTLQRNFDQASVCQTLISETRANCYLLMPLFLQILVFSLWPFISMGPEVSFFSGWSSSEYVYVHAWSKALFDQLAVDFYL